MVQANRQGQAIFLTNLNGKDDTESETSSRCESTSQLTHNENGLLPAIRQLTIDPLIEYIPAPKTLIEETFEEFEERIESNFYAAQKVLRNGKTETMLLDSELRNLQFRVFNEN